MKKAAALLVTLLALGTFCVSQAQGEQATAELVDAQGDSVGTATLTPVENGVRIQVDISGFTAAAAGEHGFHIHQTGQCTPDFMAAGEHFNPTDAQHGLLNPEGPHAGDLPNLRVDADGNASYGVTTDLVTLEEGERSLFDADGSAFILHTNPDDYVTDPGGTSGDRLACGVIVMGQGGASGETGGAETGGN